MRVLLVIALPDGRDRVLRRIVPLNSCHGVKSAVNMAGRCTIFIGKSNSLHRVYDCLGHASGFFSAACSDQMLSYSDHAFARRFVGEVRRTRLDEISQLRAIRSWKNHQA
jgi:hypothetical protein